MIPSGHTVALTPAQIVKQFVSWIPKEGKTKFVSGMRALHLEVGFTIALPPSWSTIVHGRCKYLFSSASDPAAPGPSVVATMPPSSMVYNGGLVVIIRLFTAA